MRELIIPENVEIIKISGWPLISGRKLERIVNMSRQDYDEHLFKEDSDKNYLWYISEDMNEVATYLPAKSTIYRRKANSTDSEEKPGQDISNGKAKEFLDLYEKIILSQEISAREINTREQLDDFIKRIRPGGYQEIECAIEIPYLIGADYFVRPSGHDGRARIALWATNTNNPSDKSTKVIYITMRYEPDDLETIYIEKYSKIIKDLQETGISMSIVNTPQQAKKYIENLILNDKDERLLVDVVIITKDSNSILFKQAVAGTKENPYGEYGSFCVVIDVKNTMLLNDLGGASTGGPYRDWTAISIIPDPYENYSDNLDSTENKHPISSGASPAKKVSGGLSTKIDFSQNKAIIISKLQVTSGTWEVFDGHWKLKLSDGSYAASQWAILNGTWYLFGSDGYMLTGWQLVNGTWYLFNQDGAMLTGWQCTNEKWYYFEPSGAMLSDSVTPDGYKVNKNGEWVQ